MGIVNTPGPALPASWPPLPPPPRAGQPGPTHHAAPRGTLTARRRDGAVLGSSQARRKSAARAGASRARPRRLANDTHGAAPSIEYAVQCHTWRARTSLMSYLWLMETSTSLASCRLRMAWRGGGETRGGRRNLKGRYDAKATTEHEATQARQWHWRFTAPPVHHLCARPVSYGTATPHDCGELHDCGDAYIARHRNPARRRP